jgi:carboxypeptidase PM20D1
MTGAVTVDLDRAVANYQRIVRLATVSRLDESEVDWAPFDEFHRLIPEAYPALTAALEAIPTSTHSLLYRWPGSRGDDSVVLMAHYDVVAVGGEWSSPPFAGTIDGEGENAVIRGRGVIDDKASLVGILESVEALVASGFTPVDDVYLAFSHNEEVLGDGTPGIVDILENRNVRPRLVLDEGGIVGESIFPGTSRPSVQIGVSEKGTSSVRIVCTAPGGHASVPPLQTSTARLARAIVAIDAAGETPFVSDVTRRLIADIGEGATGALADAAAALAGPEEDVVRHFSAVSPDARAMVHSSAVVTIIAAGHTVNAVPEEASATVNLRIAVGDTVEAAIDRLVAAIDDPGVRVEVIERGGPSPVSPSHGREWDGVVAAIAETYGDEVLVSPYINNGGTDSRNYTRISDTVYRFSPCHMTLGERGSIHAIDEHLRVSSFTDGCGFYTRFISTL